MVLVDITQLIPVPHGSGVASGSVYLSIHALLLPEYVSI